MKRYWLLIALGILIISCVGTYYIQASVSDTPEFILTKEQGDEQEAEGVTIRGSYMQDTAVSHYMNPMVSVSLAGSQYSNEKSFFDKLDPYYEASEEMKQLFKDSRHFMRGKRTARTFYHDDNFLVNVNLKLDGVRWDGTGTLKFHVSVMDKKKDKTLSYDVSIPDGDLYQHINAQDVQVFGDEIIVIIEGFNRGHSSFHRYSLSLKEEKMITDQAIEFSTEDISDPDVKINERRAYESNPMEPHQYNVFYVELTQVEKADAGNGNTVNGEAKTTKQPQSQEILSKQMFVYDLQTGQSEVITSPDVTDFLKNQWVEGRLEIQVERDVLYMTDRNPKDTQVLQYNLIDGEATLHEIQVDNMIGSRIKGDRIYLLTRDMKDQAGQPSLVIINLDTGEPVYEGSIDLKGTVQYKKDKMERLNVDHIIVD